MLQQLLNLLENSSGNLTQQELCSQLGISPAALQAMLDILVRKGRLSNLPLNGEGNCSIRCADCPLTQSCTLSCNLQESYYRIQN